MILNNFHILSYFPYPARAYNNTLKTTYSQLGKSLIPGSTTRSTRVRTNYTYNARNISGGG